ncbi:sigma 54-interacting transcriptional regulator [Aeoliella sp. ICT_H6.2]|uniref:Sigma 54-interacting transcriptional regulator n=1 Tax=Aeoliella straminimaris TaxID=2954799 RepID=A0A9X2JIH8_9BACT|nr:sigma 54-interacting transcriptional regulator [Aeoliella straminimaris]MCO6046587.1 sigma 54-interacting transcriptional regulator [Aeoliella straminimaris]
MTAYLVIREGSKWTDVFRLVEGESVTIGRAPTNAIVVKDERCSRNHAEIFQVQHQWTLRDLDSRNGTQVDGSAIKVDYHLEPGDIIRIGNSHLAFVDNLSHAFPDPTSVLRTSRPVDTDQDVLDPDDDESVFEPVEPTQITHRRGQSRFLEAPAPGEGEEVATPKVGRAAAKLCRLAFELAKTTDVVSLANTALGALFESTQIDAGGLLLRGRDAQGGRTLETLEVIASRSESAHKYHRVSQFLASTVMRDGQGVLARNVMDDSQLGARDSSGDILATSVICAPIRQDGKVLGILHLYSTDAARPLDPDDLEFSLAVADTVSMTLQNLDRRQELAENLNLMRDENVQLREQLGVQSEIVGGSEAMHRVAQQIARAAPSRATVLIRGESGVGKELVARAVHFSSPRKKGPFVCLNCAALSETLLESELFGHEKGAFTGATHRKVGKFEQANKGTLMLDEIGEMSPTIQAKFLRVLEGHPFERVGGAEAIKADVRVIAATNRDLEKEVSEGRFRRDLYFRLHVLEIIVPALRKRPEDIPELAKYFLHRYNAETGRKIRDFTPRALEELQQYRWPGNVREMKNVIERAVVLARGEFIDHDDLILSTLKTAGDTETGGTSSSHSGEDFTPCSLAEMEQQHILLTLESTGWNKSKAASILGIERSTLDRKIQRYELLDRRQTAK